MTEAKSFMNRNQQRIAEDEDEITQLEAEGKPKEEEVVKQESDEGLSTEEKNFKKRYGDLRRHTQKVEAEWKKKFEDLEERLKENKSSSMPKTKEDVEAWVKKYPDVAAIVEKIADRTASARDQEIDSRLKQVERMSEEVEAKRAEAALLKLHPDFDKIKESQDFYDWLEDQPEYLKDSMYGSLDVKAASRAIDLYKNDKGIKTTSNKDAAKAIPSKSGNSSPEADANSAQWSESKVKNLSDRDYEKFEGDIMESMRKGKFVYDLSGSAR